MASEGHIKEQRARMPVFRQDGPMWRHTGEGSRNSASAAWDRTRARGKFLYVGEEKFWVRGVTYGTFRSDESGNELHDPGQVERDFALMRENGINSIRLYTIPPRWLLDEAHRQGLRVMVGLPWEQHIAFLDEKGRLRCIEERVKAGVRSCAGHPAVLCYAIGNEIPASIVRWHGKRRVEAFIKRLWEACRDEDPEALFTYVNYPTTEYLQLPFLDIACFNVYLESQGEFEAYLARLQNLAGDKPLLLAEIGLDSRRNGEEAQADSIDWQVRSCFASGAAGTFVFAWTDEWHRGGHEITDWDFGVTRRDRSAKPALDALRRAYSEVPFPPGLPWPRVSVVVCTYNGARTLDRCLKGLKGLDYPDYEVIVVNDGSTDSTAAIAGRYGVRLISVENGGLSRARNIGLNAATGQIIAYIDDDAYPDPHWLTYLAATFMKTTHAGVGGPNLPPPGDGTIAQCVANSPGGPVHVLVSDLEAEHIPGCNMAFRKEALEAVGGFDPRFAIAGDDVDLCWRLQQRGHTLGYSPAAVVWHHRRNSLRAYWRQQKNYGKAEAMLETKWPEKYNALGHLSWKGRMYGTGVPTPLPLRRWRVYQGVWGSALFQSVYSPAPGLIRHLPMMPEWYLVIAIFGALSLLGLSWGPLLWALPLLALSIAAVMGQAVASARHSWSASPRLPWRVKAGAMALTAFLHLMQPLARLLGRMRNGLLPWRRRGGGRFALPRSRTTKIWSERWQSAERRLASMEAILRSQGAVVARGGEFDRWDMEIRGGLLGGVRIRMAIEEHGAGRQQVLFRSWPRLSPIGSASIICLFLLSGLAAMDHAWIACAALGIPAVFLGCRAFGDCASATASCLYALRQPGIGWS
jgi:GT2 family glycosyltransferase